MRAEALAAALGGQRVLHRVIRSEFELMVAARDGLPSNVTDHPLATGLLSSSELYDLVIPRRALARRRAAGQPLTVTEADRLLRVVRVLLVAEAALGDVRKARLWLRRPNNALRGEVPLRMLETYLGSCLVERVLGRIEHGVFS